MSMLGTGMVMRSFPFFPIISPFWMYLRRLALMRPRMISRKRLWSCLILSGIRPLPSLPGPRRLRGEDQKKRSRKSASRRKRLVLGISAREDRRHVVEHVRRADLAVAVALDHAVLDDVDLLLRVLVDHRRDQVLQLDRILLVLEELELERLVQALVGPVVERLALDGEGADVVHDLAAEVVLARFGDVDLLLDRAHEPLVGLFILAGVLVADLLALRVRLDVVD